MWEVSICDCIGCWCCVYHCRWRAQPTGSGERRPATWTTDWARLSTQSAWRTPRPTTPASWRVWARCRWTARRTPAALWAPRLCCQRRRGCSHAPPPPHRRATWTRPLQLRTWSSTIWILHSLSSRLRRLATTWLSMRSPTQTVWQSLYKYRNIIQYRYPHTGFSRPYPPLLFLLSHYIFIRVAYNESSLLDSSSHGSLILLFEDYSLLNLTTYYLTNDHGSTFV